MFTPVIPTGGLSGWRFLQETYDKQFAAFSQSIELKRDVDYFRETIGGIGTAEQFVDDRRLMQVALTAFGLEQDLDSKFFIRKILEEGTTNEDALANRFADPRYSDLSAAFGFGPGEFLKTGEPLFAEAIIERFEAVSFEVAAGEQDQSMRFALYAERELGTLAQEDTTNDTKWFTIMGEPPLRSIFETALGLPTEFGQVDIEQQLVVFKERAAKEFGTDEIAQFTDPEAVQDLVTKFLVRDQIKQLGNGFSSGAIALTLLQNSVR
ncbi:DUF1217 domain-containing protein [Sulfitobacter sp. S190]|uniref:DUF1217 domain-containing protein n=1 Tax=Sulfitobacter sp. S190 TaxID=2867022 RepID=UPI0021A90D27|nr:DUF1217 domain-containing protein [Sulfitobacter sp. S190]UWR22376.1 DUF1217 domain-containing protein [Sulfitobacter sp. S190]